MKSRIPDQANIEILRRVARRLDTLLDNVVFVGGTAVDLLITDPAAPAVRATKDVDVIVEVAGLREYYEFGDSLRALGFKEDSHAEDGPLCRWIIDDIKVDIMPARGEILGFANDYYTVAVQTAIAKGIDEGLTIRLVSAPCFLATKLDAFRDRGQDDFMGSSDMEDVIAVLDGRPEAIEEIRDSPLAVKKFLADTCAHLLEDDDFMDSLAGHLEFAGGGPERVAIFIDKVREIAAMSCSSYA